MALKLDSTMQDILAECYGSTKTFAKVFFPERFRREFDRPHEEIFALLDDPKAKKVAICATRDCGKSSIVNLAYAAKKILFREAKCIVPVSKSVDHVRREMESLKQELITNPMIREFFGDIRPDIGAFNRNEWLTSTGVMVYPRGAGQALRGARNRHWRPDLLICHVRGSQVWSDGRLVSIESLPYPKREIESHVIAVEVWGIPHGERVTPDHQFYAMKKVKRQNKWSFEAPSWVRAGDLTRDHFIGEPIDTTISDVGPIEVYKPGAINERDNKGRVVRAGGTREMEIPDFFSDPEWWWVFGYWWGNGHVTKRHVGWTIPDKKPEVRERLIAWVEKIGRAWHEKPKPDEHCTQVLMDHTALAQWLRSQKFGKANKTPKLWVQRSQGHVLKQILMGYIDADGFIDYRNNQVRITSVHYEGLLAAAKMLARLGISASIRKGAGPQLTIIQGIKCQTRQKYDLRFRDGAREAFGYDIDDGERYEITRTLIRGGHIWRKVRAVRPAGSAMVVPITTPDHTYLTPLGLNHNCDDLEDDEVVRSEIQRKAMRDWFFSSLRGCVDLGNDNWKIVVIDTFKHEDCLIAHLLENPEWVSRRLPICDENYHTNFPNMIKDEGVEELRREMAAEGKLDIFAREFKCEAVATEDAVFKQEYFRYYDEAEIKGQRHIETIIIVEPAKSVKKHADFSAILAIGADLTNNKLYIRDLVLERMHPDEVYRRTFELQERYGALRIGVEVTGLEEYITNPLRTFMFTEGKWAQIIELQPRGKKEDRIAAMPLYYRQGLVYHNRIPCRPLEDQLLAFPRSKFDDAMDALAHGIQMLDAGGQFFTMPGSDEFSREAMEAEYAELDADEYDMHAVDHRVL